jgi:hypothetical protein
LGWLSLPPPALKGSAKIAGLMNKQVYDVVRMRLCAVYSGTVESRWMGAMKNQSNTAIAQPARPSVIWETVEALDPKRLEVNVIFTDPQATVAALKTARSLARDLGACIRIRVAIPVPYVLPLDKPPVPVRFTENLLSDLVSRLKLDTFEPSVHFYLCRDPLETLLRALSPNSLVVIGGRKHWWPTAEHRMAKSIQSKGHRVVFVVLKRGTRSGLR